MGDMMNYEWYIVVQDGREPYIARPIEDMNGKIEGWLDHDGVAHPVYEDDFIQLIDFTNFQQVEI